MYKYQASTAAKKIVRGTLEVASESLAEDALYRAGFERIISLREVTSGPSAEKLLPSLYGVKTQEVIDFSNQLATLIESGISLVTALELLGKQSTKRSMKKIIAELAEEIKGGNPFSQALGHYPQTFIDTYRQTIKAGEQAGQLETGLKQSANYLEKQAATNGKIRRAMVYPAFVLLMAAGVSILLIMVALPPLINLFNSLGARLPWMTELLIAISGFLLENGRYVLAGTAVIIMLSFFLLRLPPVKLARDRFMLKIPAIGDIIIERNMQHFCQTTAMLLQAGLRLPAIMDIVTGTVRNGVIRRALNEVRDSLVRGEGFSRPMGENSLFPPLMVEMAVVGEKTGALDGTLVTLADFYERKVGRRIDTLVAMIEPVLTLIVGMVVIFIALSMITPLYTILRSMH